MTQFQKYGAMLFNQLTEKIIRRFNKLFTVYNDVTAQILLIPAPINYLDNNMLKRLKVYLESIHIQFSYKILVGFFSVK